MVIPEHIKGDWLVPDGGTKNYGECKIMLESAEKESHGGRKGEKIGWIVGSPGRVIWLSILLSLPVRAVNCAGDLCAGMLKS